MPSRVLGGDPLQAVEELGLLPGAFVQDLVGEGEEAAAGAEARDQRARGELLHPRGFFRDGLAQARFVDAGHVDLPYLLLERHAPQQVLDALSIGCEQRRGRAVWQARRRGSRPRAKVWYKERERLWTSHDSLQRESMISQWS